MNQRLVDQIVDAVLYEGYILYPYRPSVKNRQRWTFGGLYPRAYCEAQQAGDAWSMRTECLVRGAGSTVVGIQVRFLHLQSRLVGRLESPVALLAECEQPVFQFVESMNVGDRLLQTWQEAVQREVVLESLDLGSLALEPRHSEFTFPANRIIECVRGHTGAIEAILMRHQHSVTGRVQVCAERAGDGVFKLIVRIENDTTFDQVDQTGRDQAVLRALASTHTILTVQHGEFLSLIDPPDECRQRAALCRNQGTWPVLVGREGESDTMLSSPITLYDYPQIAAESPGDFFDGTEIDEMLVLRILTLTDEEKLAAAAVDRARSRAARPHQIAERRPDDEVARRCPRLAASARRRIAMNNDWDPLFDRPRLESVRANGHELKPGDRVRLHPLGRADILDMALAGKTATIEAIEQDFEERVYLGVVLDDDPGRDLGQMRQPGHCFYFGIEEVELFQGDSSSSEACGHASAGSELHPQENRSAKPAN